MEMLEWARGRAHNREEGFKAFVKTLARFLGEMSPERLERAWDLERGAEARRSKPSTELLASAVEFEGARPKETIPPSEEQALAAIARALSRLMTDNSI
jgi:hypothetical protein